VSDPIGESTAQVRSRRRPTTLAAWVTVVLAATFAVLWIVFAVRAVDRNDVSPPTVTVPPATVASDPSATADAANRMLFPDRPDGSPGASPIASPIASPAATPVG